MLILPLTDSSLTNHDKRKNVIIRISQLKKKTDDFPKQHVKNSIEAT